MNLENVIPMRKKKKEKKEELSKEDIFQMKYEKVLEKYLNSYKQEYGLDEEYEFPTYDEFYTEYFGLINDGKQIVFSDRREAEICSFVLMNSTLAFNISYIEIKSIITREYMLYILEPVYNEKKDILSPQEDPVIYHKMRYELINTDLLRKIKTGQLIIDDSILN